ncbi:hypothetical protein Acid7E03_39570 [Acidisoma sp. 7E03]
MLKSLLSFFNDNEGFAIWVQAVGAIAIIAVTAWVSSRDLREIRRREAKTRQIMRESVATVAEMSCKSLNELLRKYSHNQPYQLEQAFKEFYNPSEFSAFVDALSALSLLSFDDPRLIVALMNLRGLVGAISKRLDTAYASSGSSSANIVSLEFEKIRNLKTPFFNSVASILRIVRGHSAEAEISRMASQ